MSSLIGSVAKPFIGAGFNKLFGTRNKNKDVLNFSRAFDLGPSPTFGGDLGAGAVGLDYAKPLLSGGRLAMGPNGVNAGATLNPDGTVSIGYDDSGTFGASVLRPLTSRSISDLDALQAGLQPGFGKVTQARRNAIENARLKATGDLRDTLARRRIEGSSFGNASVSQAEAEFAKATAEADAQSYLEELDATTKIIQQKTDTAYKTASDELSRIGLAQQFQQQWGDIFSRNAAIMAQLAEQDLSSRRGLIGTDLATRRGAGVQDVINRRGLAATEEQLAGKAAGNFAEGVVNSFDGTNFMKLFGLGGNALGGKGFTFG